MKLAERNGVVFLNGINVWHQGFELSFTGVKQYYNTRNELISMKMFYPDTSLKAVKIRLIKRIIGSLICMRYGDIELIYKAVIDYMKGIQRLRDTDIEALHKEVSEIYKTIVPFKSICDLNISDRHRLELEKLADRYNEVITPDQLREYYDHKKYESGIWKMISINGWFLPAYRSTSIVTPLDSPWKPYRRRYVILYQPDRTDPIAGTGYKHHRHLIRISRLQCIIVLHSGKRFLHQFFITFHAGIIQQSTDLKSIPSHVIHSKDGTGECCHG